MGPLLAAVAGRTGEAGIAPVEVEPGRSAMPAGLVEVGRPAGQVGPGMPAEQVAQTLLVLEQQGRQ